MRENIKKVTGEALTIIAKYQQSIIKIAKKNFGANIFFSKKNWR